MKCKTLLKDFMFLRGVRDDAKVHLRFTFKMYLISTKNNVCKVAGIVFHCLQHADNLKLFSTILGVKNDHFESKMTLQMLIFTF